MNVILTIAGSDPSGGAGIQADIKTITSLGGYAAAVITTITCQNSLGVSLVSPLDPTLVQQQITSVLSDNAVSHIKIGMTGSSRIIQAIGECLADFSGEIILDPVLKSSSGTSLLAENPSALTPLLHQASVLTPNTHELALLSGTDCSSAQESVSAGQKLMQDFPNLQALCLKGGHLQEEKKDIQDTLLTKDGTRIRETSIRHRRHHTRNSHGTGCTFASAFTTFHAQYHDYERAFSEAVRYVEHLLKWGTHDQLGAGIGGLVHYRQNRLRDEGEMVKW